MDDLIELIDRALEIAISTMPDYDPPEQRLNQLIETLKKLKQEAQNNTLVISEYTYLGFGRFVLDWVEPLDSPLLDTVAKIDDYYKEHW